jgi:hypothetical protein
MTNAHQVVAEIPLLQAGQQCLPGHDMTVRCSSWNFRQLLNHSGIPASIINVHGCVQPSSM